MNRAAAKRWFWWACLFELGFVGLALAVAALWPAVFAGSLRWTARDAGIGTLAAGPLLGLFFFAHHSRWRPLADIRVFLEGVVRPIFRHWSLPQLALLSLLAGVGEESFFRGAVQGGLTRAIGFPAALLVASVAFGLGHCVSRTYAGLATLIGVYLGGLAWATGNLLAPILAHGLYDFAALVYFLRLCPDVREIEPIPPDPAARDGGSLTRRG